MGRDQAANHCDQHKYRRFKRAGREGGCGRWHSLQRATTNSEQRFRGGQEEGERDKGRALRRPAAAGPSQTAPPS